MNQPPFSTEPGACKSNPGGSEGGSGQFQREPGAREPRLEDQPADSAAVKTAKAALRARFIEYELPAGFVTHLRADRNATADVNRLNQGETQGGVENTELIGQLLDKKTTKSPNWTPSCNNKASSAQSVGAFFAQTA